eukprot:4909157-Amphidinium_carterae.1
MTRFIPGRDMLQKFHPSNTLNDVVCSECRYDGLFALQAFSMLVAVMAKFKLEGSQREVFRLYEEKRLEMISERVKRYEAEFAQEQLGALAPKPPPKAGPPSVVSTAPSSATQSTLFGAASVKSAPAALCEVAHACGGTRRSGECLPPDALVWVEGTALPQEVRQ